MCKLVKFLENSFTINLFYSYRRRPRSPTSISVILGYGPKTDAFAEGKSGIRTEGEGQGEGRDDEREGRSCGRQMVWPPGSLTIDFSGFPVYSSRRTEFPNGSFPTFDESFLIIDPQPSSPGIIRVSLFPPLFPPLLSSEYPVNPIPLLLSRPPGNRRFRDICERVRAR